LFSSQINPNSSASETASTKDKQEGASAASTEEQKSGEKTTEDQKQEKQQENSTDSKSSTSNEQSSTSSFQEYLQTLKTISIGVSIVLGLKAAWDSYIIYHHLQIAPPDTDQVCTP
jgi:hypothetical protein